MLMEDVQKLFLRGSRPRIAGGGCGNDPAQFPSFRSRGNQLGQRFPQRIEKIPGNPPVKFQILRVEQRLFVKDGDNLFGVLQIAVLQYFDNKSAALSDAEGHKNPLADLNGVLEMDRNFIGKELIGRNVDGDAYEHESCYHF